MYKIYLLLVSLICLFGCSTGLKPLKFTNGKPVTPKSAPIEQPTIITNTVTFVNPTSTNKIKVNIPVVVSQPKESLNLEDITVTVPKEIQIIITIPSYTNNLNLSDRIVKKSVLTPGAIFLYFLCVGVLGTIGWYIWNSKQKKTCNNAKIKLKSPPIEPTS